MRTAGIDLGSTTIKLVVLEAGNVIVSEVVPSVFRPLEAAEDLIARFAGDCPLVATGYGRDLLEVSRDAKTMTEIKAHAMGGRFLVPDCSAVIDIGGQDVKAIALDERGTVGKFEMNDRCAAGTGKFLEVMAGRLGFSIEEFSSVARQGNGTLKVSSMCTVFAESEVVGLLNRGQSRESLGHAIHESIANRIAAMFARTCGDGSGDILCTGGGALNSLLVSLLGEILKRRVVTHAYAQFSGAIGCAMAGVA